MYSSQSSPFNTGLVFTGLCAAPILSLATSFFTGWGFSLLMAFVIAATRAISFALRTRIVSEQRLAYVMLPAAGLSALAHILIDTFIPGLSFGLGVFIPLIAAYAFIIETQAAIEPGMSFVQAQKAVFGRLMPLIGFVLVFSLVRELIGTGRITLFQDLAGSVRLSLPGLVQAPMAFFGYTAAGFILFGITLAYWPGRKTNQES